MVWYSISVCVMNTCNVNTWPLGDTKFVFSCFKIFHFFVDVSTLSLFYLKFATRQVKYDQTSVRNTHYHSPRYGQHLTMRIYGKQTPCFPTY